MLWARATLAPTARRAIEVFIVSWVVDVVGSGCGVGRILVSESVRWTVGR